MAEREPSMRLDVFLWHVRLARTRSAAQSLAATGRMRLDGRLIERAATLVRQGSILTFAQGPRVRAVRIEALPHRRGPACEAQLCYTELTIGSVPTGNGADGDNIAPQASLD